MPSVTKYLVADYNLQEKTTTTYRLTIDPALGWITDITNETIGTLWFPKYGVPNPDPTNSATTLKVGSLAAMGQAGVAAVYGSPTPVFPVEIVALIDYAGSPWHDSGTDSSMDVSTRKPGLPPPLMEVKVDYRLPAPVEFSARIQLVQHDPWYNDGCNHRFQLVGSTLVLAPAVSGVTADGVITSTTYRWHVVGAQALAGTVDQSTDNQPLKLSLNLPGTVVVTLQATVTSQVGTGPSAIVETGTRVATYAVEVLTPQEAELAVALCKLLQETLPIPRMVFPGDPAVERVLPAVAQRLAELQGRFEQRAATFVQRLNQVIAEYREG